jgi:hypothetical protein
MKQLKDRAHIVLKSVSGRLSEAAKKSMFQKQIAETTLT